jgi:hypothetical protein
VECCAARLVLRRVAGSDAVSWAWRVVASSSLAVLASSGFVEELVWVGLVVSAAVADQILHCVAVVICDLVAPHGFDCALCDLCVDTLAGRLTGAMAAAVKGGPVCTHVVSWCWGLKTYLITNGVDCSAVCDFVVVFSFLSVTTNEDAVLMKKEKRIPGVRRGVYILLSSGASRTVTMDSTLCAVQQRICGSTITLSAFQCKTL